MEILLAIVVAAAVIFFGALISMGNERQRKAIDQLREQVTMWAIQDLRAKHEKLVRETVVEDPLAWFNQLIKTTLGIDLNLQLVEMFDEPQSIICISGENSMKFVFSPLSPIDLRNHKRSKQSRLAHFTGYNPLLSLPRDVKIYELSVLNRGILFDAEISSAWQGLTGQELKSTNRIWMYKYS